MTDGIYQVRGLDLSNMTIVEGDAGVIVIDPLISTETAAAALALYREHRGDRPVTAVIYTHTHVDHFGGVHGVITDDDVAAAVPIVAPTGFLEHAVAENVYAGTAMTRRAAYMYGAALPRGPAGRSRRRAGADHVDRHGLADPADARRSPTPARRRSIDGVRIVFQMTPGTEAPAEMNFHFPDRARAVHGRERHPQPAQPADAARRAGARPARSGPAT